MTLPYERLRSVDTTRQFLRMLLDPKETPRVPREIRQRAGSCLRHYPAHYDVERWGKLDEIERIKADIAYERRPGIHTYHQCPYCGEHPTRSGKCAWCIEKELAVLEGRDAAVQEMADQVAKAVGTVAQCTPDNCVPGD